MSMTTEEATLSVIIAAIGGLFMFLFAALGVVFMYIRHVRERESRKEEQILHSHTLHANHDQRITMLEREAKDLKEWITGIREELRTVHRDVQELTKHVMSALRDPR